MEKNKVFRYGFTIVELLIVIAILVIVVVLVFTVGIKQWRKTFDTKRKMDLAKIRIAFESFYADYQSYPDESYLTQCGSTVLDPYGLKTIPCDPQTKQSYYLYPSPEGLTSGYVVYAALSNTDDPDVERLGCSTPWGCGIPGSPEYNYGVAANMSVYLGEPTEGPGDLLIPTPKFGEPTWTPKPIRKTLPPRPTTRPTWGGVPFPTVTPGGGGSGPWPTNPPAPTNTSAPVPTATPKPPTSTPKPPTPTSPWMPGPKPTYTPTPTSSSRIGPGPGVN